jgi:hypothetical protein
MRRRDGRREGKVAESNEGMSSDARKGLWQGGRTPQAHHPLASLHVLDVYSTVREYIT